MAATAEQRVFGEPTDYYDTGVLLFNAQLSGSIYGGVANTGVMVFAGESTTGKTYFLLSLIKSFQEKHPEGIVNLFISENALTKQRLIDRGIDTSRIIISPVATIEQWRTQSVEFLDWILEMPEKDRPKAMIALDSLGQLSTEKEVSDIADGSNTKDMTRPALVRGAFRVLDMKGTAANVPIVCTNHSYTAVTTFKAPQVMSGGGGPLYSAGTVIMFSKKKDRDADLSVVGVLIKAKAEKNRAAKENTAIEINLNYDTGLNRYYGMVDVGIEAGVFRRAGGYIVMPDETKAREKAMYANPTVHFTKDILDKIDAYCKIKFSYGQGNNSVPEQDVSE